MSKPVKPAQLQNTIFVDETAAREALEAVRWPDGPVCPHCGTIGERIAKIEGAKKAHRPGLYYCNECTGQFTVTVGTVFDRSKIPLTKWWTAVYLLNSSKKGFNAHQLHRTLKVTYKTAWFMMHRIREAMRTGGLAPMGGGGKAVEVDETYIGHMEGHGGERVRGGAVKNMVVTLVERGGSARSFHTDGHSASQIVPIVRKNIERESRLMTDKALHYRAVGEEFAEHGSVEHSDYEWARGDIHTNTVEGYYSIFKRGMKGV